MAYTDIHTNICDRIHYHATYARRIGYQNATYMPLPKHDTLYMYNWRALALQTEDKVEILG